MGCPTKVQLSKRKNSEQWYVNFPAQVAQAMDFSRGGVVEWRLEDRATMALTRKEPPQWSKKPSPSLSSQDLINQLRAEPWAKAMGCEGGWENETADNFKGFRERQPEAKNLLKVQPHLPSAVLSATA